MVMKFSELVEKYEGASNGRVTFNIIDNNNNVIGKYDYESYNNGDEESINTYNMYSNNNCKITEITYYMMWTLIICKIEK